MPAAHASLETTFYFRETRDLVRDLYKHRQWVYWADMLLSLTVGYGCAMVYLREPTIAPIQAVCFIIAGFALFRVGSYIHEITHMRQGEMLYFRVVWNILCGIPMLMPSFFYENHIDHHKNPHYGTLRDGEYVQLGTHGFSHILMFCGQALLLPLYIGLRFLLSPLTFVTPRVREWMLRHTSSFVFNYRHELSIPKNAPRKWWAAVELACSLRMWVMVLAIALQFYPFGRIIQIYFLAVYILGLNYNRNLVAHHYRNTGDEMSHSEQLEDSVNITGGWLTELFFPLNLRYHALHHLLPSMPYHNLAIAHRRLMDTLPADAAYRRTVYSSYWAVLRELISDAQRASRATVSSREAAAA